MPLIGDLWGMSIDSRPDLSSSCGSCSDGTLDSCSQPRDLPVQLDEVRTIDEAAGNVEIAAWQCRFLARFVGKVLGLLEGHTSRTGEWQEIVARAAGKCLDLVLSCGRSSRSHWLERALIREEHVQEFQVAVEDLCKALAIARVLPDEEILVDSMDEILGDLRAAAVVDLARRDRLEILQKSKILCKSIDHEDKRRNTKHIHQIAQTMVTRIDQRGRDFGSYRINPAELQRGKMIVGQGDRGGKQGIRVYHSRWLRQFLVEKTLPMDCSSLADLPPLFRAIHPNLVRLVGVAPRGDQGCSLVMEAMADNLATVIARRNIGAAVSMDQSLGIMLQIARGMRCLHDHKIIHTNLTTRNVLIGASSSGDREEIVVKVADFGLSRILSKMAKISARTGKNKDALETVDASTGILHTREADVRDFTMVCYEIMGSGGSGLPDHIGCFLSRCCHPDTSTRPQFPEICEFLAMIRGLEMRKNRYKLAAILDDLSTDELEALVYFLGEDWLLRNALDRRALPLRALREWIQGSTALGDAAKIKLQLGMGDLLADWRGAEHNFLEARSWYRMAALTGDPEALWRLGMILERGQGGIQANAAQAFALYKESAAKNYTNAIVEMGRCYSIGLVDRSESEASRNLEQALDRQNEVGELVPAIQELVQMVAAATNSMRWASNRLVQISCCSRAGRMLVAGPHNRNLRTVVEMLPIKDLDDATRYNLVKLIQNLAAEPQLLQKIVFVDGVRGLVSSMDRLNEDLRNAHLECLGAMIQRESSTQFAVYQAVKSGLIECLLSLATIQGEERHFLLAACLRSDAGAMWLEEPANLAQLQAKNPKSFFWREN